MVSCLYWGREQYQSHKSVNKTMNNNIGNTPVGQCLDTVRITKLSWSSCSLMNYTLLKFCQNYRNVHDFFITKNKTLASECLSYHQSWTSRDLGQWGKERKTINEDRRPLWTFPSLLQADSMSYLNGITVFTDRRSSDGTNQYEPVWKRFSKNQTSSNHKLTIRTVVNDTKILPIFLVKILLQKEMVL